MCSTNKQMKDTSKQPCAKWHLRLQKRLIEIQFRGVALLKALKCASSSFETKKGGALMRKNIYALDFSE